MQVDVGSGQAEAVEDLSLDGSRSRWGEHLDEPPGDPEALLDQAERGEDLKQAGGGDRQTVAAFRAQPGEDLPGPLDDPAGLALDQGEEEERDQDDED